MNLMEDIPEIETNQNAIVGNDFIDMSFDYGLKVQNELCSACF